MSTSAITLGRILIPAGFRFVSNARALLGLFCAGHLDINGSPTFKSSLYRLKVDTEAINASLILKKAIFDRSI
jgi:hypothetical protein